jgi:Barrel-sandwich domain of CusB or HlyD membrane-fusion
MAASLNEQPSHLIAEAAAQTPADSETLGSPAASGPKASEPNLAPVTLTPQRMQSIGVKVGVVERRKVQDEIRTVGNVEADETRLADVQVRFSGWVQKVYADATYKTVRQGQPLLTIYSPGLVTAEQDYLVAKELLAQGSQHGDGGLHGSESLLGATTERLKRWQIPEREIARLKNSGKVSREIEIDSPVSGVVIDRKAFPNMYVKPGTKLYAVADLSIVWIYAEVFQNDIGRVKVGVRQRGADDRRNRPLRACARLGARARQFRVAGMGQRHTRPAADGHRASGRADGLWPRGDRPARGASPAQTAALLSSLERSASKAA